MGLSEVSNLLWRERQLLELLVFKLEEEQLLLVNDRTRWLGHAAREIEQVLDEIKVAELARAVEVDALASMLGLDINASLRELAEVAPSPWGHIFRDHRQAFLSLTTDIVAMADSNRELIAKGQRAVHETLAWLGEQQVETYSQAGVTNQGSATTSRLVDKAL
ncbi:MAG: flagellar protein FlgN [Acidobacteria bacterium]|nr:flagellar protein FlgN [Acidobacteriota bacterium]